jgi:Predicted pyridoxal phosphate-dependent enzyme apparently involved in regulation of cell wall biogenesis
MIANYVGAKYAVAVTSCTAGMHLACMAANLSNNQNLITSPITFVSTANVAFYTNATPIFSDIDPKTLNLCPKNLTKTLKSNPKTKVILPVHFAGMPCDMLKIKKIADSKNISIIEDAAHALGAKYKNGQMVGSCCHSLATVFSFHPVKLIASGEGGMITTNNREFYKKLLRLRSHGINKIDDNFVYKNSAYEKGIKNLWYYEMQELGYHYRITDFQCSLAISQFKKIDKFLVKRKKLVKKIFKSFPKI